MSQASNRAQRRAAQKRAAKKTPPVAPAAAKEPILFVDEMMLGNPGTEAFAELIVQMNKR